jgi:protein-S-isoprenylcysteine O-methyltransferase Ste14
VIIAALVIYGLFGLIALVIRAWIQARATGRSPLLIPPTPVAWIGQTLLTAGLFASPAGVALDDSSATSGAGLALLVFGVAGVIVAQAQMGASWRAGVDPAETTDLITHGLFARVRNPIYSSMIMAGAGMALVVSNVVTVVSTVAILAGSGVLVRGVEEPYLRTVHGARYERYVESSGRFLPRLSGGR